jgi:hypothetical protein
MPKHRQPRIEVGVWEHEGEKYENLGSIVDLDRGYVVGYVGKAGTAPGYGAHVSPLTSWDGKTVIGAVWPISSRKTPQSAFSSHSYAYRGVVDGESYHGSGQGEGMVLRLKRLSKKSKLRRWR